MKMKQYELLNSKEVLGFHTTKFFSNLWKTGNMKDLKDLEIQYPQYKEAISMAIGFYEQIKAQLGGGL